MSLQFLIFLAKRFLKYQVTNGPVKFWKVNEHWLELVIEIEYDYTTNSMFDTRYAFPKLSGS